MCYKRFYEKKNTIKFEKPPSFRATSVTAHTSVCMSHLPPPPAAISSFFFLGALVGKMASSSRSSWKVCTPPPLPPSLFCLWSSSARAMASECAWNDWVRGNIRVLKLTSYEENRLVCITSIHPVSTSEMQTRIWWKKKACVRTAGMRGNFASMFYRTAFLCDGDDGQHRA